MGTNPFAQAIAHARATWPAVRADEAKLEAHLRGVTGGEPSALAAVRVDEILLAFGAGSGDAAAIDVLETAFLSKLDAAMARQSRDGLDDLKQRLREALLVSRAGAPPKILSYGGRSSLSRWLRV